MDALGRCLGSAGMCLYVLTEMLLSPGEILDCCSGISECCAETLAASREVLVSLGKMIGCPVEMPGYPREVLGSSRKMLVYPLDMLCCSKEMPECPRDMRCARPRGSRSPRRFVGDPGRSLGIPGRCVSSPGRCSMAVGRCLGAPRMFLHALWRCWDSYEQCFCAPRRCLVAAGSSNSLYATVISLRQAGVSQGTQASPHFSDSLIHGVACWPHSHSWFLQCGPWVFQGDAW